MNKVFERKDIESSRVFNDYGLYNIEIPYGTEVIGERVFEGLKGIDIVSIPDTVTDIGSYAFKNCDVRAIKIYGSNLHFIGEYAFYGCDNLSVFNYYGDRLLRIEEFAFAYSDLRSFNVKNLAVIPQGCFRGCRHLLEFKIIPMVEEICDEAFAESGLLELIVESEYMTIQNNAFMNCNSLKNIIFGEFYDLENYDVDIMDDSFKGCINIVYNDFCQDNSNKENKESFKEIVNKHNDRILSNRIPDSMSDNEYNDDIRDILIGYSEDM